MTKEILPNHYLGKLNTARIKAYTELSELYKIDYSSVADIFSKGADWYKKKVKPIAQRVAKEAAADAFTAGLNYAMQEDIELPNKIEYLTQKFPTTYK